MGRVGEEAQEEPDDEFEWEVRDGSTPFSQHAVAGSCAGVMEHVSMYPVDTVKTTMQASTERLGVSQAVRIVLRNQGVFGLMRGSTVIGAGCIPAHVGFFGTYEYATARLAQDGAQQTAGAAASGALATVVHDLVLTPHDVVKQRLQLGQHQGPADCALCIWRREGLIGFYRSLPVTLAMNMPYNGVLVATNHMLKKLWRLERGGSEARLSNAHFYFLTAGVSGAFASAATLPLDVVKTRIQTQGDLLAPEEGRQGGAARRPLGVLATARGILRAEGLRGLFRGLGPRVVLSAPSAAISWGTYETVRMLLKSADSDRAAASGLGAGMLRGGQAPPPLLQRAELAA